VIRAAIVAVGACALAAGGLVLVAASPAAALTTITVANSNDAGPGWLRQAFIDASSGGVDAADDLEIDIPASLGTITLSSGELHFDGGLRNRGTA
jgi:hypothetical protein